MGVPILRRRASATRRAVTAASALLGAALITQACSAYHVRRAQAERRSPGGLLYVESAGPTTGSPLVFLPGMMGTTTYWREAGVLALADTGAQVLLLDELGFGRSPWPDGEYTLEDHLAAIERTLEARGARHGLIMAGHSFGAMLAAEYAARHADSVRQVVLFGTPLYRNATEARQHVSEMSALAGLAARKSQLARLVCFLHTAFLPATARLARMLPSDLPPAVVRDGSLHFWPSLSGSVENVILRHSIEPALATLGSKVTLIHGRRDAITPLARVREVAAISGAALVETDDDHLSYWRGAEQLVRQRVPTEAPAP